MALKRQTIIDAVITRLKLINGASPYYLDLDDLVFDSRPTVFSPDECPAVNVIDGNEEKDQELLSGPVNIWYRNLNLEIKLVVNGTASVTDVRKGIADIQKAISTDLTWGALAIDTDWNGTTIQKDQEELKVLSATVNITIKYSTTQWLEE